MKYSFKHCCEEMTINLNESQSISYNEVFDEYALSIPEDEWSYILIGYCPWCGKKLPKSKRLLWFDELDSLGFDAPLSQDSIPEKYKSAKWRLEKSE